MKKYDALKTKLNSAREGFNDAHTEFNDTISASRNDVGNIRKIAEESARVSTVAKDAHIIIEDIDRQFKQVTKLNGTDITFLFFATALQVARQYLLTNFKERVGHAEAEKPAKIIEKQQLKRKFGDQDFKEMEAFYNGNKNSIDRIDYYPILPEVAFSPVPFDVSGGGGFEHRAITLGHDPVLGWIFGTANIATSTITFSNFLSNHVRRGPRADGIFIPKVTDSANTLTIFNCFGDRLFNEGNDGKLICAVALIREALHLKSDINSIVSLPIPFASLKSPEFAKQLAGYGLDTGNLLTVGKQAAFAAIINTLISMIHYFFYNEERDYNRQLYEVRTRKILSYSNVIASSSNLIAVAIGSVIGVVSENPDMVKKSLNYLDIGGLLVTIHRIASDYQFIKKIKQEFLEKEFYKLVMGNEFDF
jgi:hypothetical protein